MSDKSDKVVVVGDGMVGKTALLHAFVQDNFQMDYIPTVFETTAKDVVLTDGRTVTLGLWDTGGQEEFDQIRQIAYPGASLVILCYSVDSPTSLDNVVEIWIAEVRSYCPATPLMLVGCKSDKRNDSVHAKKRSRTRLTDAHSSTYLVSPARADEVARQIGAHAHIECSALNHSNITCVFELAARFILDHQEHSDSGRKGIRRMLSFNRTKSMGNGSINHHSVRATKRKPLRSLLSCVASTS